MKYISIMILLSFTGCNSVPKIVAAMAKDPATVHISIRSVYGVVDIDRVNANTNTAPHSITPDGAIQVK